MPLTFTVDYTFLIETSAGWLVLAIFAGVWGLQYWRGNNGVIGKLLAFKNFAFFNLFLHMMISAWWVAFTGNSTSTDWLFQNYRRLSLGLAILAYVLLQIEIYRQKHGQRNKDND